MSETPDPARARPPAATETDRRAAHRARMEADRTKRDAEAAEQARADQRIVEAAAVGFDVLPAGVGAALAAMLEAMKPFRASDGHMSSVMVSRSSPEVLALAEALLATQPPIDPEASVLEQVIEALHVALDEHDDSTCNMRSNGVVDGYDHDIVRALLLAGWIPPLQPPPPASEAERVLAGLVAEMTALAAEYQEQAMRADMFAYRTETAAGVRMARRMVEAAHQRLAEQDRGREL